MIESAPRALTTLRAQLVALALTAVAVPLVAVTFGGVVMLHMHDGVNLLAIAVASAAAALVAALVLAGAITRRVRALEAAAARIAAGDLAARAPTGGPREVAHLGSSFNEMAGSIERLFDARRQLVAWASHDLRTPVTSIQAMLEAIEDGLVEPDQYVPALAEQAATLSKLIDDLFELAQIDSGALTLELRDTQVEDVVAACVRGLAAEARARNVELRVAVDEPLPLARCAPQQVQRALVNLLTNALRHTPSDGSVVVSAKPAGDELAVVVDDSGEGLSEQTLARMFERFWRGDAARTRATGGAGLGLAIARGLIEAQGGRIWAENSPEGGARVGFTLPVSRADAPARALVAAR